MAATSQKKVRRHSVHHCWNCGTRLPSPWQGRKVVTAIVVALLLLVGVVGGWHLASRQVVTEQQSLDGIQKRLEAARQQLAAARQRLEAERQRLAEAGETPKPVEEKPVPSPPEKTWTKSLGIAFVQIPAGTFQMGSNDTNAYNDEKPVHQVTISKPFYLGKYEVTQAQWRAVMGNNPSNVKGETLPVENVSWDQVQEFISKLNTNEKGPKYRLPTEAEWEYAARAGTTTAYSFGDDARQLGEYAWYGDNTRGKTHPIGQKKPNAWSLYDMYGNVWEWVQDLYGSYTVGSVVDPTGPSSGSARVYRGGCWGYVARDCRSAYRRNFAPGARDAYLGFRLLREMQ